MNSLDTVLSAIQALYTSTPDTVRQREINEYLVAFASSEESWEIASHLLSDTSLNLQPQVVFFAANILHKKIRKEWIKVSDDRAESIYAAVGSFLAAMESGTRPFDTTLFRIATSMLAAMSLSSIDKCKTQLHLARVNAQTGADTKVLFFLSFSRHLYEQLDECDMPYATRETNEMYLRSCSLDIISIISRALQTGDLSVELRTEALLCLETWVSRSALSLGTIFTDQQDLLSALLDWMRDPNAHQLPLVANALTAMFSVSEYPPSLHQEDAQVFVAERLLQLTPACETAINTDDEEVMHALTSLITEFTDCFVEWVVEGSAPESLSVGLGNIMLSLSAQPRRRIASLTLDFWLSAQEGPVADRHVFYREDAFTRLLYVLLRQCSYPEDAGQMDDMDVDDLEAYRSEASGLQDVLFSIFALLKEKYVQYILDVVNSSVGRSWSATESAVFALCATGKEVCSRLESCQQGEPLEVLVTQVLTAVMNWRVDNALLLSTTSALLGQLSAWLKTLVTSSKAVDVITSVLEYLDRAMTYEKSQYAAAKSFMHVVTKCSDATSKMNPEMLTSTLRHFGLESRISASRMLVVEGLIRVAAVSPNCSIILQNVLAISIDRIQQVLDGQIARTEGADILVTNELRVLGTVIRFLDAPSDIAGGTNVTLLAVQSMWPLLEPISQKLTDTADVVDALFQLYSWCFRTLRQSLSSQLPVIAPQIVHVFGHFHYIAPVECASTLVDVFGKLTNDHSDMEQTIGSLIHGLSQTAFQHFYGRSLEDSPELLRCYYDFLYRCLLFCPRAVFASSDLQTAIDLGLMCVGNQERLSTTSVVTFLTYFVSEREGKLAAFMTQIDECVVAADQGARWIDIVLSAVSVKSPSMLLDVVARLFFALLESYNALESFVMTLRQAVVTRGDELGLIHLPTEDREHVFQLWMLLAAAPTRQSNGRFRALCTDVAKVCRKELGQEVLYSYELE